MERIFFNNSTQSTSISFFLFTKSGTCLSTRLFLLMFMVMALMPAALKASPLNDAVRDGKYDVLKSLINQGTPVDQVSNNRTPTALISVIMKNDSDIAEYLILHGANVNAVHPGTQCSALQLAAGSPNNKSSLNIVKLLVDKGANINLNGNYCAPPIMEASITGHLEIVQFLLQKNADVNLQKDTSYALYEAIINGHHDIALWLLNNGANPNLVTVDGSTAILIIAQYMPDLFLIALNKNGQLSLDKQNRGALGYAISGDNLELFKLLINSDAPQEELDEALRTATTLRKDGLVEVLISHGANPDAQDRWGESANSIKKALQNEATKK